MDPLFSTTRPNYRYIARDDDSDSSGTSDDEQVGRVIAARHKPGRLDQEGGIRLSRGLDRRRRGCEDIPALAAGRPSCADVKSSGVSSRDHQDQHQPSLSRQPSVATGLQPPPLLKVNIFTPPLLPEPRLDHCPPHMPTLLHRPLQAAWSSSVAPAIAVAAQPTSSVPSIATVATTRAATAVVAPPPPLLTSRRSSADNIAAGPIITVPAPGTPRSLSARRASSASVTTAAMTPRSLSRPSASSGWQPSPPSTPRAQASPRRSVRRSVMIGGKLSEWEVLVHREEAPLGLSLDMFGMETAAVLSVQGIVEFGTIWAWNEAYKDFAMQKGDVVVEVNGVRGEPVKLMRALQQPGPMRILVRRPLVC
mmetsp:Transcript_51617/g.135454  ORF Transcript_51617/g.135454 Transcript_51617/m.135454 type:complete len:365 (+) Transcript_51617:157-1251(+)